MRPLLEIRNLTVSDDSAIVRSVSLHVESYQPLTVVGETGCGKSLLAQAVMGVLPPELKADGEIFLEGVDLLSLSDMERRALWGKRLAILPQEPWLALDPTMRALPQVQESYMIQPSMSKERSYRMAKEMLAHLDLSGVDEKLPLELSGGMAQRVTFAAATAGGSGVMLVDEPTKGLDADRRHDIVDLLLKKASEGMALLVITHDIEVARRLGGRIAVMYSGEIVEQGVTEDILNAPEHQYTQKLLGADPASWKRRGCRAASAAPVVKADSVAIARGGRVIFHNQNFAIAPGEIVGVTGPSGCGKSTFGDLMLGLLKPDTGTVWRDETYSSLRYQKLYQDPPAAFPRYITVGLALSDMVRRHNLQPGAVADLMERLRLQEELLERLPSQVSGGELQRFALLRVLLLDPVFLFADEPTSRLDLITQQEMMELLIASARERECALLLVSHHSDLVEKSVDRIHPLTDRKQLTARK